MLAAVAFCGTTAFAQLENKKGEAYLPESGDWSIGIDATPFLNYAGNLFNGGGLAGPNNAPGWNFLNGNNTIIGKMYTSETSAYRAIVRIGMNSTHAENMVVDNSVTTAPTFPAAPTMATDEMKMSSHFIGLGAGIEMRRGKTRLQGFYGADFMFWMSGSKTTYDYGVAYSSTVPNPNTTNWGSNIAPAYSIYGGRVTEEKSGSVMGLGVRGFIGAEYFVLPKISIGGEFGWGVGFSMTGEATATVQAPDPSSGAPNTTDYTTAGKSGGFSIDTDKNMFGTGNASLRMNFHF